jgi:methyl-accepting chemotaxis protein
VRIVLKRNRIRNKIIKLNMISVLATILVLGTLLTVFTISVVKEKKQNDLIHGTEIFASKFNEDFLSKTVLTNSFEAIIKDTIDLSKVNEEGYFENYINQLVPIVRNYALIHGDFYIFFNHELSGEPHDIWFLDYNMDGVLDRLPEMGIDYYDGDLESKYWYYGPIKHKKGVWSEPYKSTILYSHHFVTYSKAIYLDDVLIGVTGSDFILEDIMEEIRKAEINTESVSAIVNEDGKILLHSASMDLLGSKEEYDVDLENSFEKIKDKDNGVIEYINGKDEKMVLSFNRLISGWYLLSYIEEDIIYEDLYILLTNLVTALLIFLIISLVIAWRSGRSISRPIELLTEEVLSIGNQIEDESLPQSLLLMNDEIGILSNSFLKMKTMLKDAYSKIENQNTELDTKVSIRTEELTAINQELIATLEVLENAREELIDVKTYESMESMFSGMSHRLGGPVGNAIVSLSSMIKEINSTKKLLEKDVLTKSKFLNFIDKSEKLSSACLMNIENAHELIKSLKNIELGFIDKEMHRFDVNDIFVSVIGMMKEQLNDIGISVNFKKNEEIFMYSHSKIFSIIMMNFIKFSIYQNFKNSSGGNIYIKTSLEGNKFLLKYWDDGKAISKEEIETLFDPFSISRFTQNMTGFELYQNFQLISRSLEGTLKYDEYEDAFVVVLFTEQ